MSKIRLEVAVDNLNAALQAAKGGAGRIELCSSLADGGLTPSLGMTQVVLASISIPVHCMVRPRAGNFVYSREEIAVMLADIAAFRDAGAHGVVLGVLTRDNIVDVAAVQQLIDAARPMRVCFHRAFDHAVDRSQALESVIGCGADVLLTSGGAASLHSGAAEVTRLVKQAAGRIEIMGGAGVRINNAAALWQQVPVDTLHGSLRSPWREATQLGEHDAAIGARDEEDIFTVRDTDVRALVDQLTPRA